MSAQHKVLNPTNPHYGTYLPTTVQIPQHLACCTYWPKMPPPYRARSAVASAAGSAEQLWKA